MNSLNRLGETYSQAMGNSRRELDQLTPPQPFISFKKDESERIQLRKLKRQWLFDLAAQVNMPMFKGNKPNVIKAHKQHFERKLKTFAELKHFNYNLS